MKAVKLVICLGFVVAAASASFAATCCGHSEKADASAVVKEQAVAAVEVATEEVAVVMPKMIDFGSKECKACKAMEPVLEALMKNHADKFTTEFVDVWVPANGALAKSHGVSSIPTQVFFGADGKEIFRHTGFISEEQVLAKWQELGVTIAASETKTPEPAETAGSADTAEPSKEPTESAVEEKTE